MIIEYEKILQLLDEKVYSSDTFYVDLLENVIKNPMRYTGIFRLSNPKTKLIQNVTQSREIKFGGFVEALITLYIEKMGFNNQSKNLGPGADGKPLNADQVFTDDKNVYLIEQKIRDDHDSAKKRGQFDNFVKKLKLLAQLYPDKHILGIMWFIDANLVKNKKFYLEESSLLNLPNTETFILYGEELFSKIFDRMDVWTEFCSHLDRNKRERSGELLLIPDFDTSPEILTALQVIKLKKPSLYSKLTSNEYEYVTLRNELFPSGISEDDE